MKLKQSTLILLAIGIPVGLYALTSLGISLSTLLLFGLFLLCPLSHLLMGHGGHGGHGSHEGHEARQGEDRDPAGGPRPSLPS